MTMLYLIGATGQPQIKAIQQRIPDVGLLLAPGHGWQTPCTEHYACDNGVYGAFVRGEQWNEAMHQRYALMLNRLQGYSPPMWVLLPDVVADWNATVALSRSYLPLVRHHGLPVAIALQDGCRFDEAMQLEPDCVFVAGSTEWKLANIVPVCQTFQPLGIRVHVGRVNTQKRMRLCQGAGVDSCDGTTLNRYLDASLPLIAETLNQASMVL